MNDKGEVLGMPRLDYKRFVQSENHRRSSASFESLAVAWRSLQAVETSAGFP